MDNKSILIVIPCLNEEKYIESLVLDLLKNNQDLPIELIIADGGSTDGTVEIAERLEQQHDNVIYLHNPKKIQSAALNLAVDTYGEGKAYVIRIDAHAGYPKDYCRVLVNEAEKTKAASIVVSMDTVGTTPVQIAVAAAQNSLLGNGGSSHRNAHSDGQWIDHGHHALMRIDAFQAVGGYDEGFSHNEDAELDKRLIDAGRKIWLTGKTQCIYYPRKDFMGLFKQYRNYGHGRIKTILKHKMKPKPRQLAPVVVFPAFLGFFLYPICSLMALPFLMWALVCLTYGGYLGYKANNLTIGVFSGFAGMVMHAGWSLGFWQGLFSSFRGEE